MRGVWTIEWPIGRRGNVSMLQHVTHVIHVQMCVLHGESSKRLATPRNTKKNKKHLQSTQLAQPTNLTDQGPSTTERTAWETHNTN